MDTPLQKIIFRYYPYPFSPMRQSDADRRACPVELELSETRVTVTLVERDADAVNKTLRDDFYGIASQLYREKIAHYRPSQISWCYRNIRNEEGFEALSSVSMLWDGIWFRSPKFKEFDIVSNFTIFGLSKTETHLVLKVGYSKNPRVVQLPLERFPSLKVLAERQLKQVTVHKHNTVIYWPALREKLIAREAVLNGAGTIKRPEGVSESDFIYKEIPDPLDLARY